MGSAHAQRLPAPTPLSEIPETIFAVGDIATCDGEDSWWEEFLEMVKILRESAGEEREKEEPTFHKFLELVGWVEEVDVYAHAEETALLQGKRGSILALGDLAYERFNPVIS